MDPTTFRRDRYLRCSAYHLATWSLIGFVLELRGNLAPAGADALSQLPVAMVLVGGAVMTSITHERRVGKMVGPAGAAVFGGAGRLWVGLAVAMAVASALLLAASRPQLVFDVWTVGTGVGLTVWGSKAGFAWYVRLGSALLATAAVDVALGLAGMPVLLLRCAVLAVAVPAAALITNDRYLWFHPPTNR